MVPIVSVTEVVLSPVIVMLDGANEQAMSAGRGAAHEAVIVPVYPPAVTTESKAGTLCPVTTDIPGVLVVAVNEGATTTSDTVPDEPEYPLTVGVKVAFTV